MTVITIVTLNINVLQTKTRVEMLTSFLRRHEVDILFAQEVTNTEALQIIGYTVYQNIGATMRGTTFLTREGIQFNSELPMLMRTDYKHIICGGILIVSYAGSLLAEQHA
jgi:exonuclease III